MRAFALESIEKISVGVANLDDFALSRPGSDLLSRVLRRSTIGAGAFHGRVRNGNGCGRPAMTTRSAKGKVMRSWQAIACFFVNTSFSRHVACHLRTKSASARRAADRSAPSRSIGSFTSRSCVSAKQMAYQAQLDEHGQ